MSYIISLIDLPPNFLPLFKFSLNNNLEIFVISSTLDERLYKMYLCKFLWKKPFVSPWPKIKKPPFFKNFSAKLIFFILFEVWCATPLETTKSNFLLVLNLKRSLLIMLNLFFVGSWKDDVPP